MKINQVKYDLQTLSASDFTIELDISLDDYDQFLKNEYEPNGKE
jgi:hypothetical protein